LRTPRLGSYLSHWAAITPKATIIVSR